VNVDEIDVHVLDLLVDGASSFAALFLGLRRYWGHTDIEVDEVLRVLRELEDRRLILASQMEPDGMFRAAVAMDHQRAAREYTAWLPRATASEAAIDETGLWYEITQDGRAAWTWWDGGGTADRERWVLDHRADRGVLEVRADCNEVADRVLNEWLAAHDTQVVPGSKSTVKIPSFVMRDGTVVVDGILVTCRYWTKGLRSE
jgi:hypothetical protein